MKSDDQLLREYVEGGCEAAFTKIVSRHMDLVYSAALRQVGSSDLAQDVAQGVFADLARKAEPLLRRMDQGASLMGWLYRSTRFEALSLLRAERRRLMRDTQAMQDSHLTPATPPYWECVRPALDAAMAELKEADREAVLMRFFKNRDYQCIGSALGVSENAAQQRVSRALEKLRQRLLRQGITTASIALSTAISANAVQPAPLGLAASIATSALGAGSIAGTSTLTAAVKTIAMTTMQKTLIAATVTVAVATGLYEAREASNLREQVRMLQQQHRPLTDQINELRSERDRATNQLALLGDSGANDNKDAVDLLRLRREVGGLRQRTNELGQMLQAGVGVRGGNLSADKASPDLLGATNFPRNSWTFAGLTTPEDALQSYMWAKSRGDVKTAFAVATPELKQEIKDYYFKDKSDEEISALLVDSAKSQTGFQILKKLAAADDQLVFQLHIEGSAEKSYTLLTMKRADGEWKVSSVEERADGN